MSTETSFEPGSYSGDNEGVAGVYIWIAGIVATAALLMPWGFAGWVAGSRHMTLAAALGRLGQRRLGLLVCIDLNFLLACLGVGELVRALSRRIRLGGPEARDLDRLRLRLMIAATLGAVAFAQALMMH